MPRHKPAAVPTMPPPRTYRGGMPTHAPTEAGRNRVIVWSGGGMDQDLIAASLGINRSTLRKHYAPQLAAGRATMDGLALSTLAKAMQGGGKEAVAAAKWWTQARMGWSEKLEIDDGKANVPMRVVIELVGDAPPVTIDQARQERVAFDAGRFVDLVG